MKITSLDAVVSTVHNAARVFQQQFIDDMQERSEVVRVAQYLGNHTKSTLDIISDYISADPKAYALGALLAACSPDLSSLSGSGEENDAGNGDGVGMMGDGNGNGGNCSGNLPRESCGLNGRGSLEYACRNEQYEVVGCNDPDVCEDGEEVAEACGLNRRGMQNSYCIEGQFEPGQCVDPDVCVDTTTDVTACGYNGNGTKSRTCVDGEYGPFGDCVDPDECADGTTETRPCSTDVGVCVVGTENYDCASSGGAFRMVARGDCDGVLPGSEDSNDDGDCTVADLNGLDEDCNDIVDDGSCMVGVAAGEFSMGCDGATSPFVCHYASIPLHTVDLSAYFIDKFEVTNGQYQACEAAGVCTRAPDANSSFTRASYYDAPAFDGHPVIRVTWTQAGEYCAWVGKRLPTEAEWEKAAKGASPSSNSFPWGSELPAPDCDRLNYNNCIGDTVAVGSYPTGASPYGALDMAGNVTEWVNDWYSSTYYEVSPTEDPPGPITGKGRSRRGGNFASGLGGEYLGIRTTSRSFFDPSTTHPTLGFRCAKDDLEDL